MPLIVAHRGLHHHHPENSASAFAAAWDAGIKWCECDIHFTADGVPVVMHDETLDRMTTMKGKIASKTWREISAATLIDSHHRPIDEAVPSLDHILRRIPRDGHLLIEIKPAVEAEMVLRHLPAGDHRIALQSFDEKNLVRLKEAGSEFLLSILVEDASGLDRAIDGPWDAIGAKHSLLDADMIRRLKDAKKRIAAWTVNDPGEMRRLADLGIAVLITDEPLLARQILISPG